MPNTYDLLWNLWCTKKNGKNKRKKLLEAGKPVEINYLECPKEKVLILLSKQMVELIEAMDNEEDETFVYEDEYATHSDFLNDLIYSMSNIKCCDIDMYKLCNKKEIFLSLESLGIKLVENKKLYEYYFE